MEMKHSHLMRQKYPKTEFNAGIQFGVVPQKYPLWKKMIDKPLYFQKDCEHDRYQ